MTNHESSLMVTAGLLWPHARTSRSRRTQETSQGGGLHYDQSSSGPGSAVPLDSWDGVTLEVASVFVHADISYVLNGNIVIVRKMGKADIYYGMCG